MEAEQQKPVLVQMLNTYTDFTSVFVMDRSGMTLARGDDNELQNYSDRVYFIGAMAGSDITRQTLVGRSSGKLSICRGTPIRDGQEEIVGAAAGCTNLDVLTEQVGSTRLGQTGFAFLVNELGQVLAHPTEVSSDDLVDLSDHPAVKQALRRQDGLVPFVDENSVPWLSYALSLDNGWAVIVQQQETEVLAQAHSLQFYALGLAVVFVLIIAGLIWWITGWLVGPIAHLTEAARTLSTGQLTQVTLPQRDDEIGILASTFNTMAEQLRDLIANLEQRIVDRTRRLEILASLSERLNAILDFDRLLNELVNQVKENFDYYHAHVYIIDDDRQNLVMTAGAGEAGAKMKAKGHSIPLNAPTSLVGRAARTGEIVWVDNVREVKDWLPNPLLPHTYSEMAVPIFLNEEVVGVLDVQEDRVAGLDEGDANLLRSLSNQVSVAIRNARLFAEVESALIEARAAQERYLEQSWDKARITDQERAYLYLRPGASALAETIQVEAKQQALQYARPAIVSLDNGHSGGNAESRHFQSIVAPVAVGNKTIGALQVHQIGGEDKAGEWTDEDLALVEAVLDQVAQAAETMRLFDETRQQVSYEHLVGQITEKLRRAPTLEILARTAAEELGQALGVAHSLVKVGMIPEEPPASNRTSPPENGPG
jgi:GAF domain-containing protein/HAMP domain-containing protein